jgi:hypothetical protein
LRGRSALRLSILVKRYSSAHGQPQDVSRREVRIIERSQNANCFTLCLAKGPQFVA